MDVPVLARVSKLRWSCMLQELVQTIHFVVKQARIADAAYVLLKESVHDLQAPDRQMQMALGTWHQEPLVLTALVVREKVGEGCMKEADRFLYVDNKYRGKER
jgi:hypothetical protein